MKSQCGRKSKGVCRFVNISQRLVEFKTNCLIPKSFFKLLSRGRLVSWVLDLSFVEVSKVGGDKVYSLEAVPSSNGSINAFRPSGFTEGRRVRYAGWWYFWEANVKIAALCSYDLGLICWYVHAFCPSTKGTKKSTHFRIPFPSGVSYVQRSMWRCSASRAKVINPHKFMLV